MGLEWFAVGWNRTIGEFMANGTIPPPPSGQIVDTDPMAQVQAQQAQPQPMPRAATPGQIPPPPSGSIVDFDPSSGGRPQTSTATISAGQEPTTYLGKFGRWAENVANDIKYGTDHTGIGTVLQKMGAHGVYNGNSDAVGDFMASLPLGLLKMGKGSSEVAPEVIGGPQGKTWQGLKDVVGGGFQAATIPAAFVAPEESALSKEGVLSDVASAADKAASGVASAASKATGAATNAAGK